MVVVVGFGKGWWVSRVTVYVGTSFLKVSDKEKKIAFSSKLIKISTKQVFR